MKSLKKLFYSIAALAFIFLPQVSMAAEEAATTAKGDIVYVAVFLAAGLVMGLGTFGPGIGQGNAVKGACEGMARNPGIAGKLMTTMLLGLAMIESLAIYALVIALILLFANPFL